MTEELLKDKSVNRSRDIYIEHTKKKQPNIQYEWKYIVTMSTYTLINLYRFIDIENRLFHPCLKIF